MVSGVGSRIAGSRWARGLEPVREARGVPRWILWSGIVITLVFVVMAVAAPVLAPYDFDQYRDSNGVRFAKQQHPS